MSCELQTKQMYIFFVDKSRVSGLIFGAKMLQYIQVKTGRFNND